MSNDTGYASGTPRRAEEDRRAGRGAAGISGASCAAQPDVIRLGHLTPRTGFLGQVGEYGFRGATLAVEEANAAGGVLGRQIELIAEDSVNPATAVTKAQKLIERDKVVCLIGEVSSASALAIARAGAALQDPVLQHRRQLRRPARAELQPLHVPRRGLQHHVHEDHRYMAEGAQPDQGRALVLPHRRLRLRPRPLPRLLASSCRTTAAWC